MTKKILSTILLSTILLTSMIATDGIQTVYADTETISIRSDSSVTMLVGPTETGFNVPLTITDFTDAKNGPNAYEIPNHNAWIPSLSVDPSAKWIGTHNVNPNHHGPNTALATALYAVDFEITSDPIDSATLTISYSSDNTLGDNANEGVFINGIPVTGT